MSICADRGWSESNEPSCAACMNPITVRGETPDLARLMGEVLECAGRAASWVAHFECRKREWFLATLTRKWAVRRLPGDRRLTLLSDRPGWARRDPQVRYHKPAGIPGGIRVH